MKFAINYDETKFRKKKYKLQRLMNRNADFQTSKKLIKPISVRSKRIACKLSVS